MTNSWLKPYTFSKCTADQIKIKLSSQNFLKIILNERQNLPFIYRNCQQFRFNASWHPVKIIWGDNFIIQPISQFISTNENLMSKQTVYIFIIDKHVKHNHFKLISIHSSILYGQSYKWNEKTFFQLLFNVEWLHKTLKTKSKALSLVLNTVYNLFKTSFSSQTEIVPKYNLHSLSQSPLRLSQVIPLHQVPLPQVPLIKIFHKSKN